MKTFLPFCIHTWRVQVLLSSVPQGSILGPILCNTFTNDLFYFIKDAQLINFADDNTVVTFSNSADELITDLQKETENPID